MNARTALCSLVLTAGLCLSTLSPTFGQDAPPAPVDDIEARRASIPIMEQHIAQRQERLAALVDEIKTLDARVEDGVAGVVEMVSGIRDSVDSQVRVAQLKADIVTGLRRSIDTYTRHRDSLREQLRQDDPAVPRATLESDLDAFVDRIELRVEQIKTIAESFTDPRDLEKYEQTGDHYWWGGWSVADERISDEWRQERKETRHTEAAKEKLIAALRESIEQLEQRNSLMATKLEESKITDAERDFYASDIARNEGLIATREAQIQEIQSSSASLDDIEPIDRTAAHETELYIRSLRDDLREDFLAEFRKYAELNRERAELYALEQNLAARKAWLRDYDAKQGN